MRLTKRDSELEAELAKLLAPKLDGIGVQVGQAARWPRTCALFTWNGFTRLLPEERFQRLCTVIPEAFRDARMAGFVWVELAPDESVEEFLKLPRSEDVVRREESTYAEWKSVKFLETLGKALGRPPEKNCRGEFTQLEAILQGQKFTPAKIRDAKLVCIRHHAYCDCQVVQTVAPELAKLYPRVK